MQTADNNIVLHNSCDNVPTDKPNETSVTPLKQSTSHWRPLAYLQDFQTTNISNNIASTKYPIQSFLNYNSLSASCKPIIMSITLTVEPSNYEEVLKILVGYKQWRKVSHFGSW